MPGSRQRLPGCPPVAPKCRAKAIAGGGGRGGGRGHGTRVAQSVRKVHRGWTGRSLCRRAPAGGEPRARPLLAAETLVESAPEIGSLPPRSSRACARGRSRVLGLGARLTRVRRYGSFSATTAIAEAFATAAPETAALGSPRSTPGVDVAVVAAVRVPTVVGRPGPAARPRRVHAARWGLCKPPWATDPAAFRAFNARPETAATKLTSATPCVLPRCHVARLVLVATRVRPDPISPHCGAALPGGSHAVRRADWRVARARGPVLVVVVPEQPDRLQCQGSACGTAPGCWSRPSPPATPG